MNDTSPPSPPSALRARIDEDVKQAMRAREKRRLAALRLIMAAIKQREVDERKTLDDGDVVAVLQKMCKQRRDSLTQYEAAGRQELADQEAYELDLITTYMPEPLGEAELTALIDEAIAATGAANPKDMGKVMAALRPKIQGRADMGQLSALVKAKLKPAS